jgi:hypothetical protein
MVVNKAPFGAAHLNRRQSDMFYRLIAARYRPRLDVKGCLSRRTIASVHRKIKRAEALPPPPATDRNFGRELLEVRIEVDRG